MWNVVLFASRHILYCGYLVGDFVFTYNYDVWDVVSVGKLELLVEIRLFGENNATDTLFSYLSCIFYAGGFLLSTEIDK